MTKLLNVFLNGCDYFVLRNYKNNNWIEVSIGIDIGHMVLAW